MWHWFVSSDLHSTCVCTVPVIDSDGPSLHHLQFISFTCDTYPNSHASPIMVNRIENLRSTVNIGRLKLNGIWTLNQLTVKSMIPSFMSIQGAKCFVFFYSIIKEAHISEKGSLYGIKCLLPLHVVLIYIDIWMW